MRNVIVTGGTRGLGLKIAEVLSTHGYRAVAIARHKSQEITKAIELSRATPGAICFEEFDLAATSKIPNLVKSLRKTFGPIYGLVNNAGLGTNGILATMSDAEIERLAMVNTVSPIVFTKYVLRGMMIDGGGGRIVNIASTVATTGFSGLSAYGATKASLVGFTRSLAREIGRLGITVNAVAPGFLDTDMTHGITEMQRERIERRSALRRLARVDDVANAVLFLLDETGANVTGTVLTVDAGNSA